MSIELYDAKIPVFVKMMENLTTLLDQAEAWAVETGAEPEAVCGARFVPDMLALDSQIQIASDIAKGAVARLAGIVAPSIRTLKRPSPS